MTGRSRAGRQGEHSLDGAESDRARGAAIARASVLLRFCGGERLSLGGAPLDLQTQALLGLMEWQQRRPLGTLSVAHVLEVFVSSNCMLAGQIRAMEKTADRTIAGVAGPLPLRIYTPRAEPISEPVIVYSRGGGWVMGDLATHDPICRFLAAETQSLVVAVDYRRAPEQKFPAAVADALLAYGRVLRHAHELGGDPSRVAVAGDSAGGNVAAEACALAREAGWAVLEAQALLYPVTDLRLESRSYRLLAHGFLLTFELMRRFREQYLSADEERLDSRGSPLPHEDLRGLSAELRRDGRL